MVVTIKDKESEFLIYGGVNTEEESAMKMVDAKTKTVKTVDDDIHPLKKF